MYFLKNTLKGTQKKGRLVRMLPYVLLSALVAFIGGRSATDTLGGGVVDHTRDDGKKFSDYIIPTAFADGPHTGDDDAGDDGCCFPGDVQVDTPDGALAIADIKEGISVISFNEATGVFTTSRVEKVLRHGEGNVPGHDFATSPLLRVVYDAEGGEQEMVVTSNHPVLNPVSNMYQNISEFAVGDQLVTQSGKATISTVEQLNEQEYFSGEQHPVVYNLTLEDGPHTYIAAGVVVHNKGGDSDCDGPGE